jgi:hypothetical protein
MWEHPSIDRGVLFSFRPDLQELFDCPGSFSPCHYHADLLLLLSKTLITSSALIFDIQLQPFTRTLPELIIDYHPSESETAVPQHPRRFLLSRSQRASGLPPASLKSSEALLSCGVIVIISYVLFVNNLSMRQ